MRTPLLLLAVLLALGTGPASAEDQILLPVISADASPGANGSLWVTLLSITNVGSDPVQLPTDCNILCPVNIIQPGASVLSPILPFVAPTALLTAVAGDISSLRVSLRVLDLSRQATSAGTEIPTIRTSQLGTDTIHLVGIPVDSRFRFTLRAYAMATTTLNIRARSMDESSEPIFFDTSTAVVRGGDLVPGYVQFDNFLAANPALASMHYFRVEVSSVPPVPIWAFIAIANNDSEQVTTITPQ
jgi:hypothetical protein